MPDFQLDHRLSRDCIILGELNYSHLLLMNNSLVPWFILVPPTSATEFYELTQQQQLNVLDEINAVSSFIKTTFDVDKLNVAAIGNIVSQMHIHIVGRSQYDYCWPGVVWGTKDKKLYDDDSVSQILASLEQKLAGFSKK